MAVAELHASNGPTIKPPCMHRESENHRTCLTVLCCALHFKCHSSGEIRDPSPVERSGGGSGGGGAAEPNGLGRRRNIDRFDTDLDRDRRRDCHCVASLPH